MTPDPNEKRRAYFREYRRKWRKANREKYLELNKQVTVKKHATLKRIAELKAEVERLRASSFVTAVPVEDYEKLKAEVERLTNCKSEADRLKAEVERLRKAGDAMALCITEFRCGKYGNALDKVGGFYVWQDWLAAKEGKQP